MSILVDPTKNVTRHIIDSTTDLRQYCAGVIPLKGRLEPWMTELLRDPQLPGLLA